MDSRHSSPLTHSTPRQLVGQHPIVWPLALRTVAPHASERHHSVAGENERWLAWSRDGPKRTRTSR